MNYATSMQVTNIDLVNKRVTLRVASEEIGTDGAIVLATAWDRDIGPYVANPVLCWNHPLMKGRQAEPEDVIGQAYNDEQPAIRTEADGLWGTFQYCTDIHEKSARTWEMTAAGILRAFSVYWQPLQIVTLASNPADINALPAFARAALVAGRCKEVHTRVRLMEISQVIVGADHTALTAARSAGLISEDEFRERSVSMSTPTQEGKTKAAPTNANARMPVLNFDNATRCEQVATCLRASDYYDWDDAEKLETLDGAITVLTDVVRSLQTMRTQVVGDIAEDTQETAAGLDAPAEDRAAGGGRGRSGKAISQARMATLQEAIGCHERGEQEHARGRKMVEDMLAELDEDETEDDTDDEESEMEDRTASPPGARPRSPLDRLKTVFGH